MGSDRAAHACEREWMRLRVVLSGVSLGVRLGALVALMMVVYLVDQGMLVHVPAGTSTMTAVGNLFLGANPSVPVSRKTTLFSMREFSRMCCDVGPTVYRNPSRYEKTFARFPGGERGIYSFKAALQQHKRMSGGNRRTLKVFAPFAQLSEFIAEFFLELDADERVVLVTGQEDCGPAELFGYGRTECELDMPITLKQFLDDNRLVKWFTQNFDLENCQSISFFPDACQHVLLNENQKRKVMLLPIGLDFHTMAEKNFFLTRVEPMLQEKQLVAARKTPFAQKDIKAIAIFAVSNKKPDRVNLMSVLLTKQDCTIRPSLKVDRDRFWKLVDENLFVFSPQGHGLDTHRVYEVLALHSIPVVRSSPLDALYKQFPIIIVNSWDDFRSCDALEGYKQEIIDRFGAEPFANPTVVRKLTLSFWKATIDEFT